MIGKELAESKRAYHRALVIRTSSAIEELRAAGKRISFYSVLSRNSRSDRHRDSDFHKPAGAGERG